jgi:hypothetical protein
VIRTITFRRIDDRACTGGPATFYTYRSAIQSDQGQQSTMLETEMPMLLERTA